MLVSINDDMVEVADQTTVAVTAGYLARQAGRIPKRFRARASIPAT